MDYPHDKLPYPLIDKQREQVQTFDTTQYFGGKLYTRKLFSKSPVTWLMTFQLVGSQRVVFQAWLSTVLVNGASMPFAMTIYCEDGPVQHTVTIVEAPLSPRQLSTGVWQYQLKVEAAELKQDYLNDPDFPPEFIVEFFGDAQVLDETVNLVIPNI